MSWIVKNVKMLHYFIRINHIRLGKVQANKQHREKCNRLFAGTTEEFLKHFRRCLTPMFCSLYSHWAAVKSLNEWIHWKLVKLKLYLVTWKWHHQSTKHLVIIAKITSFVHYWDFSGDFIKIISFVYDWDFFEDLVTTQIQSYS